MKCFFILGRNPKLSREEVFSYFESRQIKFTEILFKENFLILDLKNCEFDIQEFGGVLMSGKILFEGKREDFWNFLESREIVESDKFSYALFGNFGLDELRSKFKEERKRAMLKHGRSRLVFQNGEKVNLPKAEYLLFCYEGGGFIYFGFVEQKYHAREVEERDMKKPVRREHLAISPRLAKILINLSGAREGDFLLDPFCGVGGILQEALLKEISVYGVDIDKKAIGDAEKNLSWLKKRFGFGAKYILKVGDARKIMNLGFDAIASESPLGKVLRKKPSIKEAKQMISEFESFIIPVLSRLKMCKKPEAKIAMSFPFVLNFHVDVMKVAKESGLELVGEPINEFREKQFVSRDIVVFR